MQTLRQKKSIICFFIFFLIANTTLFAQGALHQTKNDTTYSKTHFLWFTGHWSKTKKNVFITTATTDSTESGVMKQGGGSSVTVNPNGSVSINSQSIDDWNKAITKGEDKLEKTEKEMTSPGNEQKEWAYHFNEVALPILDTMKAQWTANKIDKKTDALNPDNEKENQSLQTLANNVSEGCKTMQPKFQAIEDFYHKHHHDKDADFNNPPPPEMEYECMACDTSKEKNYEKTCDAYVDNFFKPESGFMKDALSFIRKLNMLGQYGGFDNYDKPASIDDAMEDKLNPLFSNGGPCAYIYKDEDLNKIVLWMGRRILWRAEKLLRDNKKNYNAVVPVIRVYLQAARQNCLLGNELDFSQNSDMYQIVYNAWSHYYFDLVEKHDWSQLANIPTIFGLDRQFALLGGDDNDKGEHFTKILTILNSFELNIDMDVKGGKDCGYFLSHLKGKAKIAPEFKLGADSCYEWVVIEDQPDEIGQSIKKVNQKLNWICWIMKSSHQHIVQLIQGQKNIPQRLGI